jgi:hypothetical protein
MARLTSARRTGSESQGRANSASEVTMADVIVWMEVSQWALGAGDAACGTFATHDSSDSSRASPSQRPSTRGLTELAEGPCHEERAFVARSSGRQCSAVRLPTNVVMGYSGADAVTLAANNGNPTGRAGYNTFNTAAYDPGGVIAITSRDP